MKLFKKRLCLFLSFVLASQTILYANTNIRKPSFIDYQNMLKIKILSPLITNIEYKISNKDFKNTEEMNNLIILSTNLYKSMVKDFPKDISTTAYITSLNSISKNTKTNNNVFIKESIPSKTTSHKSSGGSSSSSNTTPVADTFSKKIILNGIDVINDEISMATTSNSVLKLNNMKKIFNELFDDCKNNNITFPREYTTDEKIEIVNRLNEETRKATGSSLKTVDIYSYNVQPLAKRGYGRPPVFNGYITDICMAKSPIDGKDYPYIYTLIAFSNSSEAGFYGGKIDIETWVDGVKVTQKTPQHYGWDCERDIRFGINSTTKPISIYENLPGFDVNKPHRVVLKTNVLGDYEFDICGVKNPTVKICNENGEFTIGKSIEYGYYVFDQDMVFPKTTDSIIDIPTTTDSMYTIR